MRSDSMIWRPTFMTGFSAVIGSWKIIEICRPRISRNPASDIARKSRPSNRIWPFGSTSWRRGDSPTIERDSTVLPEPDSPTMPSVRPASRVNDTPSTERTMPRGVRKWVVRSRTSSNGPWKSARPTGSSNASGAAASASVTPTPLP